MRGVSEFLLALVRLAAVMCPALLGPWIVRRGLTTVRGLDGALSDVALALGMTVIAAEALGLVGALRFGWLAALLWVVAAAAGVVVRRRQRPASLDSGGATVGAEVAAVESRSIALGRRVIPRAWGWCAALIVAVVAAQWVLGTVDALGGGMFGFDGVWYHMPFAASFAQSASVTHIQFTQADPFVAYYPATSELLHGIGIIAFRDDFLSPLANLGWLALALAAGWAIGRRRGIAPLTLAVTALVLSLPALGNTQPGQSLNDTAGLAGLLIAVALLATPHRDALTLTAVGAALGLAVGTKYTLVVPAVVLAVGTWFLVRERRGRAVAVVMGALVVSSGWWYLRALIHTGSPLGIRSRVGPLHLPGPDSPLANASQQTVLSEVRHLSLWGSRFLPGLAHGFGVLWPVIVIACVAAVIAGLVSRRDALVPVLAVAAGLSGITYFFLPTGATAISQTTLLFTVNLRYAMPAVALALLLVPILALRHASPLLHAIGPAALAIAVAGQLEPGLWPAQTGRHVAFLAVAVVVAVAVVLVVSAARRSRPPTWLLLGRLASRAKVAAAAAALLAVLAVGFVVQRHYFHQRYLLARHAAANFGAIDAWAQTVAHVRIGTYGTLEQYPLYGASDTNRVTYLGQRTTGGGYAPIASCPSWQRVLRADHLQYVVLTSAPTTALPTAWSLNDPDLKPILHPSARQWVLEKVSDAPAIHCP